MLFWTAEHIIYNSLICTSRCQNHGFFLCWMFQMYGQIQSYTIFSKLTDVLSNEYVVTVYHCELLILFYLIDDDKACHSVWLK